MSEVFVFKPLAEKRAEENLSEFIQLCRNKLTAFGKDLPFDDLVWDVTPYVKAKGKTTSTRFYFSSWDTVHNSQPHAMPEPFGSFAKAYTRYQHAFRPVIDQQVRVAPLRAICAALTEVGYRSPVDINSHVLNRAAQMIAETFSPERAYRLGQNLQLISQFADENQVVKIVNRWRSPIPRPVDTHRVGKEFDERRQEKLPSPDELNAVAQAYQIAREPEDLIVTSITAIMCATPDRIAEILTLPVDCEHFQRLPDGTEVYGLRYRPGKGGDPMVKWVIPSMVDLVKEAVGRLRRCTENARMLARWYEDNPLNLYLPSHLEGFRGSPFTVEMAAEVIYGNADLVDETVKFLKRNDLCPTGVPTERLKVGFHRLEEFILSRLPKDFPILDTKTGLRYSEALCVVHKYVFNQQRGTMPCFFESISHGQVENGLGAGLEHGKSSVFSRLGITDIDGNTFNLNTHKFRHYLNTLAMHGGLDELDIAKWSGRKDVRQNRAYDHVSARDKLVLIRAAIGDKSKMFGPLGWAPSIPTISRDEFARLKVTTAHTTEFGYCIHDFTVTPCQLHVDCLNCNELVCIKGDEVREANIRRQRDETIGLLENARQAEADEQYGANRWVDHQVQTLQRLDELCAIFDDPAIQHGAVIQLKHLPTVSKLVQAAKNVGVDLSGKRAQEDSALPGPRQKLQKGSK
jgi:hypothetical protein